MIDALRRREAAVTAHPSSLRGAKRCEGGEKFSLYRRSALFMVVG